MTLFHIFAYSYNGNSSVVLYITANKRKEASSNIFIRDSCLMSVINVTWIECYPFRRLWAKCPK